METKIFAHRGARWCRPENTLASFQQALREKADGIELDVHLSKDNELIVIHDETVNRTTNAKGFVHDLTLSQLKTLDAGCNFKLQASSPLLTFIRRFRSLLIKKVYTHEKIPTLGEVLDFLEAHNFTGCLNIEVKTDHIHYPDIETILSEEMVQRELSFTYLYSSFNFRSLELLHELEPTVDLAYLTYNNQNEIERGLEADFITALHPKKSYALSKHFEPSRKPLRVWTVNAERDIKKLLTKNVAAIITDYPEKARRIRKQCQK